MFVTQLVKGGASGSYYITAVSTSTRCLHTSYCKLLLRSISAVAKAGSCLLFHHILADSLRQTGVTQSSCPANTNGAIGGVCMGRYSCRRVNSPRVALHLQPSSAVLVYVALAPRPAWRGEAKSASCCRLSG